MNEPEVLDKFAAHLKSQGKQPATVESYCRDARRFLTYSLRHRLDFNALSSEHLQSYQDHLQQHAEKENSIRRTVIGVRQFFRFLKESGNISETPFDTVPIPERRDQLPGLLDEKEFARLIAACDQQTSSFFNSRNRAILYLLALEGIKATELIDLCWSHYLAPSSLQIPGSRARVINLNQSTSAALKQYHSEYQRLRTMEALKNAEITRMFIAFRGRDGSIVMPQMSRHGLKFILYELGRASGIHHINTERLRHFAVRRLIEAGKNPDEIMQHLGLRRLGNIAKHLIRASATESHAPQI